MRQPQRYVGGEMVLVIDCADLERSAGFWCEVLGYQQMGSPVGQYMGLTPPDGVGIQLLLQRVDDPKTSKNRLHLDLRAEDFEKELERVLAAGARQINEEPLAEYGWTWHVLADPDGNEFCLIRPPAAG